MVRCGTICTDKVSIGRLACGATIPTRLSKVITSTFLIDHMRVDLAGRDVVIFRQRNSEITFVVSKVKVDFSTIIQNVTFSMPLSCQKLSSSEQEPGMATYSNGFDKVSQRKGKLIHNSMKTYVHQSRINVQIRVNLDRRNS